MHIKQMMIPHRESLFWRWRNSKKTKECIKRLPCSFYSSIFLHHSPQEMTRFPEGRKEHFARCEPEEYHIPAYIMPINRLHALTVDSPITIIVMAKVARPYDFS